MVYEILAVASFFCLTVGIAVVNSVDGRERVTGWRGATIEVASLGIWNGLLFLVRPECTDGNFEWLYV